MQGLIDAGDRLYLRLNGLSRRSGVFDSLVALAIDNNLLKAAPIAAPFLFALQSGSDEARLRARRGLLAAVASLLFVLSATKTIAGAVF